MSNVLAFDTALNGCSAAVVNDDGAGTAETMPMQRGHAEELLPLIARVLAQAGMTYNDIDLIGVTVGPGNFTGLRIGLATARALGLALAKPVVGVTTTNVLAAQFQRNQTLLPAQTLAVILETKRADFYAEFFGRHAAPAVAAGADFLRLHATDGVLAIGDGIARFGTVPGWQFIVGYDHPDPLVVAQLALSDFREGRGAPPEPVYLRPPDVTAAKRPLRTIGT